MMAHYDVGRGSLREALRMLELNGLVSLKPGPGGGPVVEAVNPAVLGRMLTLYLHVEGATYRELVAARLAVEPTCAGLAAATATVEAKQHLAELGSRAHELDLGDDTAYRAMSHEFHRRGGVDVGQPHPRAARARTHGDLRRPRRVRHATSTPARPPPTSTTR